MIIHNRPPLIAHELVNLRAWTYNGSNVERIPVRVLVVQALKGQHAAFFRNLKIG